jgi:hypothetical protein
MPSYRLPVILSQSPLEAAIANLDRKAYVHVRGRLWGYRCVVRFTRRSGRLG